MMKITGLDKLQKDLGAASAALQDLGGTLGTVHFDPTDPASIEAAIQEVEDMVDSKLGSYADNPIIAPLAAQMKDKYRTAILDRAAAARLESDDK